MHSKIYLAKDGVLHGPFAAVQLDSMKKNKEFFSYEWMWDGSTPDWIPVPRQLKSPPPLPQIAGESATAFTALGAPASTRASTLAPAEITGEKSKKTLSGIGFFPTHTISGKLKDAHSRGATFFYHSAHPAPFVEGMQFAMDVMDEANDQSAKVKATIQKIERTAAEWKLTLTWDGCSIL